jgi:predicted glutamine amidotransferase
MFPPFAAEAGFLLNNYTLRTGNDNPTGHPDGRGIVFYSGKGGNEEVWAFRNLLSPRNK